MNCPTCHQPTQVTNSRPALLNNIEGIRRRRECSKCGKRFSTFEYICDIPRGNVPKSVFHPGYDPSPTKPTNGKPAPKKNLKQDIKEALRRARAKIALEEDEIDLSEFDDEDFD